MSSEHVPLNAYAHPAEIPASTIDVDQKCEFCDEICVSESDLQIHRNCWKANEFLEFENCDEFVRDSEEDEPDDLNHLNSLPTLQDAEVPRGPQLIPSFVSDLIKFLL